jgi:hypothetical protein
MHLDAEPDDPVGESGTWFRGVHGGGRIGRALPKH